MKTPASPRAMSRLPVIAASGCVLAMLAAAASAQSLYEEATFRPLTADRKAFRVGDILTVQILESAAASANADTRTQRSNTVAAELARAHVPRVANGAVVSSGFDGGGTTLRAGKLVAQVSVTVLQVLPGGDLRVGGDNVLLINQEQQRIGVQGRVRPHDISSANVVLSSRLAEASITYVGEGDLAQRQQRAWWRQGLDWLGL
jgi:flagellar L-ring protein precursor FlgH